MPPAGEDEEVSLLPSRHAPAMYRQLLEAGAGQSAEAPAAPPAPSRRAVVLIGVAVALAVVVMVAGSRSEPRDVTSAPRGSQLVTSEMAGLPTGVGAFTPAGERSPFPAPSPGTRPEQHTPSPSPSPNPSPFPNVVNASPARPTVSARRPAPARAAASAGCATCLPRPRAAGDDGWEVLVDESGAGVVVTVPAVEAPLPLVVNLGTRVPFTVTQVAMTGATAGPLSGRLDADVVVDGRIALPVGTPLAGLGFATTGDDRMQVVVSALVVGGRSVPVQAVVLGPDHALGIPGRLVRKGSKARHGLGRLADSLGAALSAAALPGGGLIGAALADLTRVGGEGLRGMGKGWSLSDKVVEVPVGARGVLYIERDMDL